MEGVKGRARVRERAGEEGERSVKEGGRGKGEGGRGWCRGRGPPTWLPGG